MLFYFSPAPSTPPAKEEEWSDIPSDVVHLKDDTFDDFIANIPSVLVMFYAPCKYRFFIYLYLPGLVGITPKSKSLTCLLSVSCYHFVINWFLLKKKTEWKGNVHKCCVRPTEVFSRKTRSWNNSYGQFHEQPFMYWFLAFQGVVTAKLWSLNTQMQPKQWRRRRYFQFKYLTECNKFDFEWVV